MLDYFVCCMSSFFTFVIFVIAELSQSLAATEALSMQSFWWRASFCNLAGQNSAAMTMWWMTGFSHDFHSGYTTKCRDRITPRYQLISRYTILVLDIGNISIELCEYRVLCLHALKQVRALCLQRRRLTSRINDTR